MRAARSVSPHLRTVTLSVREPWTSTGIPDEYIRVLIAPEGHDLVLPDIDAAWNWTMPEGAVAPIPRVYTVADHRVAEGCVEIDLDVVIHHAPETPSGAGDPNVGIGVRWALNCRPGDRVGLVEPHGLSVAPADTTHQVMVCDLTGVPALGRILRELPPDQRALVHVVATDPADRIELPSRAETDVNWHFVADDSLIAERLEELVRSLALPPDRRYLWFAGEARASRATRKYLRRECRWAQSEFSTCGYWQFDAARWAARYAEVEADVVAQAREAYQVWGESDQGAYLDALEDIYDHAGL